MWFELRKKRKINGFVLLKSYLILYKNLYLRKEKRKS